MKPKSKKPNDLTLAGVFFALGAAAATCAFVSMGAAKPDASPNAKNQITAGLNDAVNASHIMHSAVMVEDKNGQPISITYGDIACNGERVDGGTLSQKFENRNFANQMINYPLAAQTGQTQTPYAVECTWYNAAIK